MTETPPDAAPDPGPPPAIPVLPPVIPLAALLLAAALEAALPLGLLPPPGRAVTLLPGLALAAGAVALALAARRRFLAAKTPVNPRRPALALVEDGPYRLTRNPMYLAFLALLAGLALILSLDWALVLTPAVWLALDRLIVRPEEAHLSARFGAPYRAYLARSRRWL
jgi:Putative protein-S-isoprenylcysteine methyltransferase